MGTIGTPALVPAGLVLAVLIAFPAGAEEEVPDDALPEAPPGVRLALELSGEQFRWQEFDEQGTRLLSEHGLRYGVAASLHNFAREDTGVLFAVTLRGYVGTVDYDGQDTSRRFVGTRTSYGGYGLEAGGGYRLAGPSMPLAVDLTAGLGLDRWERDIRGGTNAAGFTVAGFVEDYTITYLRLGLGLALAAGALPGHFGVGFRLPLITDEDVVVSGQTIELEPGRKGSTFFTYKVSLAPDRDGEPFGTYLRISYDSYRFTRSASRPVGSLAVWQPESDMDVLGVAFGFSY